MQDCVEQALARAGHWRTARAYVVYREQHARLRQGQRAVVDAVSTIDEDLDKTDWRENANANHGYSLGGLILHRAGKLTANYRLSNVYAPEIGHGQGYTQAGHDDDQGQWQQHRREHRMGHELTKKSTLDNLRNLLTANEYLYYIESGSSPCTDLFRCNATN